MPPMSLPVPVGTSVSIQDIGVMECLTAGTILMNETVVSYETLTSTIYNETNDVIVTDCTT